MKELKTKETGTAKNSKTIDRDTVFEVLIFPLLCIKD
jgi:hypothetical protein